MSYTLTDVNLKEKIDLVYLWVDGNDPQWRAKRSSYLSPQLNRDSYSEARFIDNDELRYSLRSIELYAPWINHIYIVTDNQRPQWLNSDNPKITIVDHTQILPPSALPTFNSVAIEMGVVNIEGLSEYFLLANDDTLLYRPLSPDEFFNGDKMRCRVVNRHLAKDELNTIYGEQINSVCNQASNDFGVDYHQTLPHHNIDIYSKSVVREVITRYESWVQSTISNRFRSPRDMQRHIFTLYALATNRAEAIDVRKSVYLKALKRVISPNSGIESMVINLPITRFDKLRLWLYNPAMLCINDNERASASDRAEIKPLLTRRFSL